MLQCLENEPPMSLNTTNSYGRCLTRDIATAGFRKPCQLRDIFHMPDAAGMLEFIPDYL